MASFDIVIRAEGSDHMYASLTVNPSSFQILNKRTGYPVYMDILNVNGVEVLDVLKEVTASYVVEHYMFYSEKPAWVDGYNGKFSATSQQDKELYITMCDGMEELVSLPPSAIYGGTFCIYIDPKKNKPFTPISEAVRLAKLNDPTLDEDDDDPAQTPFAAPYDGPALIPPPKPSPVNSPRASNALEWIKENYIKIIKWQKNKNIENHKAKETDFS